MFVLNEIAGFDFGEKVFEIQAARAWVTGLPQQRLYLRRLPQGQGELRTGSLVEVGAMGSIGSGASALTASAS